jgi:hypothetical protein
LDGVPADLAQSPAGSRLTGGQSGGALVNLEIVNQAVRAFAGVPEAPDISAAVQIADTITLGVTAQDLSNAMLDFHDSGDLGHDQVGSEPIAAPLPTPTTQVHTPGITAAGAGFGIDLATGRGAGQRA